MTCDGKTSEKTALGERKQPTQHAKQHIGVSNEPLHNTKRPLYNAYTLLLALEVCKATNNPTSPLFPPLLATDIFTHTETALANVAIDAVYP